MPDAHADLHEVQDAPETENISGKHAVQTAFDEYAHSAVFCVPAGQFTVHELHCLLVVEVHATDSYDPLAHTP